MTTRRQFFRLVAGAALAPVAAKAAAILPTVPMLHGDGVHDDTEALNALFRGDVVEFAEGLKGIGGWYDGPHGPVLHLPRGVYRTTAEVVMADLPSKSVVEMGGTEIRADFKAAYGLSIGSKLPGRAVLRITSAYMAQLQRLRLQWDHGGAVPASLCATTIFLEDVQPM